jgi:hypothetical protein
MSGFAGRCGPFGDVAAMREPAKRNYKFHRFAAYRFSERKNGAP